MEILEQQGSQAGRKREAHFRQEFIPHGHVWPSGVVLPTKEVDLYNLYTNSMNAQVENNPAWTALAKDRRLFLTACLSEAEAARAQGNPMALLRRAVAAQQDLWTVRSELERVFDIADDDKACDQLDDQVQSLACNSSAERLTVADLMEFIDAMGHRRTSVHGPDGQGDVVPLPATTDKQEGGQA